MSKVEDEVIKTSAHGRMIRRIEVTDSGAVIQFIGSSRLSLVDAAQCCCEHRYMTCDDDLGAFEGASFLGYEVREVFKSDENGDAHDCAFLLVHTSLGDFTIASHNEHNGYYGGFRIEAKVLR